MNFTALLVDGGWSDWQNVTNCSTTCGEGVITQQRTCTQPSPSCGGRECSGINITNISCSNKCCRPGNVSDYVDVQTRKSFYVHCTYVRLNL